MQSYVNAQDYSKRPACTILPVSRYMITDLPRRYIQVSLRGRCTMGKFQSSLVMNLYMYSFPLSAYNRKVEGMTAEKQITSCVSH